MPAGGGSAFGGKTWRPNQTRRTRHQFKESVLFTLSFYQQKNFSTNQKNNQLYEAGSGGIGFSCVYLNASKKPIDDDPKTIPLLCFYMS